MKIKEEKYIIKKHIKNFETIKEIILNSADYESEVDICTIYNLNKNISCYLEIYNGEVDLMINKHYKNKKDEYDNWYSVGIEPNLKNYISLIEQLKNILKKEVGKW